MPMGKYPVLLFHFENKEEKGQRNPQARSMDSKSRCTELWEGSGERVGRTCKVEDVVGEADEGQNERDWT